MCNGLGGASYGSEVLRWMSDLVRCGGMSPVTGGMSTVDVVDKATLHFGGSAFKDADYRYLLAFAMAVPPKLVDMIQSLHFALVSPARFRLPAHAFAKVAALPREYPYAKVALSQAYVRSFVPPKSLLSGDNTLL